jgi:DNA helicase IV
MRPRPDVRAALERIWPVLTPAELLHDLFGSRALLDLAASSRLSEHEIESLYRPRSADVRQVRWTSADVALLDDAREVLGPRLRRDGRIDETEEIRTYGHIVVDEVQDLTPMQLRMAARRSLNGSMTVVGDLAQATGALAPDSWAEVLAHLPQRKPARVVGLSVGYRIPAQIMALADRVMAVATPDLRSPRAVRVGDASPSVVDVSGNGAFGPAVAEATATIAAELPAGNVAVVVPDTRAEEISAALDAAGIEHGRASRTGLDDPITVVPVSVIKGLELDGVVVVEPAQIVADEIQGLRALYVALTRPTQRLTVVHAEPLPPALAYEAQPA